MRSRQKGLNLQTRLARLNLPLKLIALQMVLQIASTIT
jgi:hypothetical protein